jgi:transglutaminase-like putative cysteine protease
LEKGYGVCWNKALLRAALLHTNQIPDRLAFNPVKREFMKPVMGDACQTLPETINHCFAQVQLGSDWICVDATLDAATYEKFFVPHGAIANEQSEGQIQFWGLLGTRIKIRRL